MAKPSRDCQTPQDEPVMESDLTEGNQAPGKVKKNDKFQSFGQ